MLLCAVEEIPLEARSAANDGDRVVVALGELTGHAAPRGTAMHPATVRSPSRWRLSYNCRDLYPVLPKKREFRRCGRMAAGGSELHGRLARERNAAPEGAA